MSLVNESKRAICAITKKRILPPLIHQLIGFRVFKAYAVEPVIIT
jgi:hypothetical protein